MYFHLDSLFCFMQQVAQEISNPQSVLSSFSESFEIYFEFSTFYTYTSFVSVSVIEEEQRFILVESMLDHANAFTYFTQGQKWRNLLKKCICSYFLTMNSLRSICATPLIAIQTPCMLIPLGMRKLYYDHFDCY